jgi:hypothetical protein
MKLSGPLRGYLVWMAAVSLWLSSAFGFGWRASSLFPAVSSNPSRSGGGYLPNSSWSPGK